MSKRALKKYLKELDKEQLEEQILDLYQRFKDVKVFYDFTFNPQEEKKLIEAKDKVKEEYFPRKRRRARARRSVAQKYIRHFQQLGFDPQMLADLMLYNVETAIAYNAKRRQVSDAFFKSILTSFQAALEHIRIQGLKRQFEDRIEVILGNVQRQRWFNSQAFKNAYEDVFE